MSGQPEPHTARERRIMPRVPIAEEYRTGEGGDRFPKLKLQEKGEKARYVVIEVPWREYVHFLKAPVIEEGIAVKETKHRRNGDEYQDYKLDFVGSPICLGDEGALAEKGVDEQNCPACEASVSSGGEVYGPAQRFAVNVIKYDLRGGTWDIRMPFSAEIVLWTFNGRAYDDILGIQKEIGDLRQHDLTLECEDSYWQRNKLAFKMEPGYKQAPAGYIKELLSTPGNRATEEQLRDACGRTANRQQIQDDVDVVLRRWRQVRQAGSAGSSEADDARLGGNLSEGIDELLAEADGKAAKPKEDKPKEDKPKEDKPADDPFSEFRPETTSNPAPEKPAKEAKSAEPEKPAEEKEPAAESSKPAEKESFSFDELLGL